MLGGPTPRRLRAPRLRARRGGRTADGGAWRISGGGRRFRKAQRTWPVQLAVSRTAARGALRGSPAMAIPPVLRSLLTATGPSGYETAPAAVFREAAGAFAEVTTDVMGSTWARVKGTGDGPTLAIVGPIDEIGLIVTHIDDDGFLRFTGVGGWDTQILVGQRLVLSTRDGVVPGVIGKKPIHLLKDEERKKVAEIKDLHIDIGAADGDEARGRVRIGDVAVMRAEPLDYPNGRAVS